MDRIDLHIVNSVSELEKLTAALEDLSARWQVPSKVTMQLNLVLEELVTNIMFHGHQDGLEHGIDIEFSRSGRVLSVVVTDDAPAFNLLEQPDDSRVDQPLEERRIGGLGIRFVKTVMDRVEYVRRDGKNVVTLTKQYDRINLECAVELTEQTADSCTVLSIIGRLDTANYGVLEAKLADLFARGASRILVDCGGLEYVSSSGLRVFLTGLKKITAMQGKFVLCSLQEGIREIFEISGFSDLFETYPSRDQALEAFRR